MILGIPSGPPPPPQKKNWINKLRVGIVSLKIQWHGVVGWVRVFLNSIVHNFFVKEIFFDLRMTIKKRDGPRRLTSISAVTGKKPEKFRLRRNSNLCHPDIGCWCLEKEVPIKVVFSRKWRQGNNFQLCYDEMWVLLVFQTLYSNRNVNQWTPKSTCTGTWRGMISR